VRQWPYNDMRERQLRILASKDVKFYTYIVRIGERLLASNKSEHIELPLLRTWTEVINVAVSEYGREPTPSEITYAELRVRNKTKHSVALTTSGIGTGRDREDVIMAMYPVYKAIEAARQRIVDETRISKDDVVQGLLNAVSVARDAKELTMAWRELGLLMGYYEETKIRIEQRVKSETTVTHKLEGVDMSMLSDEALMQHAGAELLQRLAPAPTRIIEHKPGEAIEDAVLVHSEVLAIPKTTDPETP